MSGTGLTLSALAAMVLGCAAVGAVGQVARAHAAVDSTADLAGLAVAARSARGEPTDVACAAGSALAVRSGSVVTACTVVEGTATVQVETRVRVLGLPAVVTGLARAGPVPTG